MCKLEGYKFSFSIKGERATLKAQEKDERVAVCFKLFEKIVLHPSLVPALYFSHFKSIVNDLKPEGCAN
jgi:hypothetical protein